MNCLYMILQFTLQIFADFSLYFHKLMITARFCNPLCTQTPTERVFSLDNLLRSKKYVPSVITNLLLLDLSNGLTINTRPLFLIFQKL